MERWHEVLPYDFSDAATERIFTEKSLFFDIETTGFSPANTTVYLIGCAAREGSRLIIDQFFAKTPEEETEILAAFFSYLKDFDTLITFNGVGFDIPYLKGRCVHHHMAEPFSAFHFVDIFKEVSHLKFLLSLPNYKQKSVEAFLGIDRDDLFSGGELIEVYRAYVKSPSEEACHLLKLHNYEDVLGMPKLLPVLSYCELFSGNYTVESLTANEFRSFDGSCGKELLITLHLNLTLPKPVSCSYEEFYLTVGDSQAVLCIRLHETELKYFFSDYRNYYYLPDEDTAVLKDVAQSVDKMHRKNATASTCYQRKYAIFLPQYEEVITPPFRENYRDKKSYFELTEAFVSSAKMQSDYAAHILKMLASGKRKR